MLAGLAGRIAAVVDGGPCRVGTASSVVAAGADGGFVILREGALSREEIAGAWGSGPRE